MSSNEEIRDMLMPVFIEASFHEHDKSDNWRIPDQTRRELGASLGLKSGQVAAYAYLAEHRAEEEAFALDLDVETGIWETNE